MATAIMLKIFTASRVTIYFDMDGCLAVWAKATKEELEAPGFFLTRDRQMNLINACRMLISFGFDVHILTAVMDGSIPRSEKLMWLEFAGIDRRRCIFVPYGEKKEDYILNKEGCVNILVDDYSKNLHQWTGSGNYGIKFRNGVNGSHGTWQGASIYHWMPSWLLFAAISFLAAAEAVAKAGR